MNKNGFTLVELLAVIAVMGIIIAIAVPATGAVKDKLNEYMLGKKIKLIEKSAILYGEDYELDDSTKKYNGNSCIIIQVKDLVPEYLDSETDNGEGFIEDVTNKGSYLDEKEILIYKEDESVKAIFITDKDKEDNNYICS